MTPGEWIIAFIAGGLVVALLALAAVGARRGGGGAGPSILPPSPFTPWVQDAPVARAVCSLCAGAQVIQGQPCPRCQYPAFGPEGDPPIQGTDDPPQAEGGPPFPEAGYSVPPGHIARSRRHRG